MRKATIVEIKYKNFTEVEIIQDGIGKKVYIESDKQAVKGVIEKELLRSSIREYERGCTTIADMFEIIEDELEPIGSISAE